MASAIGEAKLYDQAVADCLKDLLKAARKLSGEVTELSEDFIKGNKQISSPLSTPPCSTSRTRWIRNWASR